MTRTKQDKLPPDELLEDVEYRDGDLYWKPKAKGKHNKHLPIASNTKQEYRIVHHEGEAYSVHRVVYYIHTGDWPDNITFLDGNPRNCKYENLLAVTDSQLKLLNSAYNIIPYTSKKGDITYQAGLKIKNEYNHLGSFERKIDAMHQLYLVKYMLTEGRAPFPECTEEEKKQIKEEFNIDVDEINHTPSI